MNAFDKRSLSERDICTKFITPAERRPWGVSDDSSNFCGFRVPPPCSTNGERIRTYLVESLTTELDRLGPMPAQENQVKMMTVESRREQYAKTHKQDR